MPIHESSLYIKWETPEYVYVESSPDWFWGVALAAIVGVVLSIVRGDFLFTMLVLVATFLVIVYTFHKPKIVEVEISEAGIRYDGEMHPFAEFHHYWIKKGERGEHKLLLHSLERLFPLVSIPVPDDMDIPLLREILLSHLEERELKESIFHGLIDRMGF